MEQWVEESILQDIDKCIKVYGIEGMLEKIGEVFRKMPTLQERYYEVFYKKYPFLKK